MKFPTHLFIRLAEPYMGLLMLLFPLVVFGQDHLTMAKEYQLGPVTSVSADAYGDLYIARESGEIQKVDREGRLLYVYSPDEQMSIDILDSPPSSLSAERSWCLWS